MKNQKFYLLIAGGREYNNVDNVILFINAAMNAAARNDQTLIIVHGAALGADSLAGKLGKEAGLEIIEMPADWNKYGKSAGYKRNIQMADLLIEKQKEGNRCEVLTFQGGNGTKHMRDIAQSKGLKLVIAAEPK
jgi:hypothetical protein